MEAGDLFEWHEADDCFVRYTVTEVKPDPTGTVPRKLLAVEWMTYAFTGCSGAVSENLATGIDFGPLPDLGGTDLISPVRHGIFQVVPEDWTGAIDPGETHELPEGAPPYPGPYAETRDVTVARGFPYWREPQLPTGWRFSYAFTGGLNVSHGYCAFYEDVDGWAAVEICGEALLGPGTWRISSAGPNTDGTREYLYVREARWFSGRPAAVRYSPEGPLHHRSLSVKVWVHDVATQSIYTVVGVHRTLLGSNVEDVIAIARSLFEGPTGRALYDTYDTTGAVSTPGSYVFLADPDDTSTAVTTYEALRDGTTTALLIHKSDADGASRGSVYDAVQAGDLFEWHKADDCFVRYQVTEVKPDPAGTVPRKLLGVAWLTYAFAGCSGTIETGGEHRIGWSPANITSPDVTSPIRHGNWLIVPQDWTGAMEEYVLVPYRENPECEGDEPTTLEEHAFGRRPALPDDWVVENIREMMCDLRHVTYRSADWTADIDVYISRQWAVPFHIPWVDPSNTHEVVEATMIDGHPAVLRYDSRGFFNLNVKIYHSSGIKYEVWTRSQSLVSNRQAVIDIARSLYDTPSPTPATSAATTFRYGTYDTTGAVSTPGSYAFLSDPDDTSTVVTTYEALRDGTATALLIHTSDAVGVSRADVYDAVAAGDLFEWHKADDCFVRYTITEVKPDPTGAVPRKALVVQWTIYAFTGCGESIASSPVSIIWGPQPALGGDTLTVPVMVGIHQLVPENWTGAVRDIAHEAAPGGSHLIQQANPSTAVLSELDYWREPKIPEGWSLAYISAGTSSDPYQGFSAIYSPTEGIGISLEFHGYFLSHRNWQVPSGSTSSGVVVEARVIAGRPALIEYSPPGDSNDAYRPTTISIMDLATESGYTLTAYDSTLKNIDTLIAIASSLFAEPPPGGE